MMLLLILDSGEFGENMLINNEFQYDDKHFIIINNIKDNIYYYIDYDKRSVSNNMEFQHLHPFYEILILLAPNASHLIEGTPYNIHAGDMVLLAPSVLHKSIYYKGDASKRIVIDFMFPFNNPETKEAYDTILAPFYQDVPIMRFDFDDRKKLSDILNKIYVFADTHNYYDNPADEFHIHTLFQEFLYTLYELSPRNIYSDDQTYTSIEHKIYEIASYIHNNYDKDLSLESLAQMYYLSPSYLSREFKSITHFNLLNYIQLTRIKNAQYKLSSTNDKISAIAESCGFTSFSQFNRVFNKISGASPREYRNTVSHKFN